MLIEELNPIHRRVPIDASHEFSKPVKGDTRIRINLEKILTLEERNGRFHKLPGLIKRFRLF